MPPKPETFLELSHSAWIYKTLVRQAFPDPGGVPVRSSRYGNPSETIATQASARSVQLRPS